MMIHFCGCRLRRLVPAFRGRRLREFPSGLLLASLVLSAICASCGAVGSNPPPPPASVTVQPSSAKPFPGGGVQFSAQVQNAPNSAVDWQVNQMPGGSTAAGTIDGNGYYTAPSQVPSTPTVTVTAVLLADSSVKGSASVTIQSLSGIQSVAISPKLASVTLSQPLLYQVRTPGVTAQDLSWAVDGFPGGNSTTGTISPAGLYVPPAAAGGHTVTATVIGNSAPTASAQVEVTDFQGTLTWRNDNARSGVNSQELVLAPSTVNSSKFGKLFSCPIDGYAYAQPLYVPNLAIPGNGTHNVVFVATEKDLVYAFDADAISCQPLWPAPTSLIPAGSQAVLSSNLYIPPPNGPFIVPFIVPFVGITGTPVIDVGASRLYVVGETQTAALNPAYNHYLFALDLATGSMPQPNEISIASPDSQFYSRTGLQRSALLLDNGSVYVAFGSNGVPGDYHGWLFKFDASLLQPPEAFNVTPSRGGGGIWQSGGGPSADSSHNVYVVTGEGGFDANPIPPVAPDYGDSFLQFGPTGGLSVADYFAPCDQATDEANANDVGASAPVLLPDAAYPSQPHLLIGGSKGGSLYIVNRDAMGGFFSPCPDSPTRVQTIPLGGPILSTPLFWQGAVYVAPGNGHLMSLPLIQGILAAPPPSSESQETLGPQGATPVISANVTSNAVLWLIDTSGALTSPNTPAVLRAFNPSNLSADLYNSAMLPQRDTAGLAVKFAVPTVANGKVYVGTQSELDVYGLLPLP
jgi:hypothetical protein